MKCLRSRLGVVHVADACCRFSFIQNSTFGIDFMASCFPSPMCIPYIGYVFIGCYASWRWLWNMDHENGGEKHGNIHHGTIPSMTSSPQKHRKSPSQVVYTKRHNLKGSCTPLAIGVATSISCILSFCGGTSCADFRFDFDAFGDGGDGWGMFLGFLEGKVLAGKPLKLS